MTTLVRGESIKILDPVGKEEIIKIEIVSSEHPPGYIRVAKFVVPADGLELRPGLPKDAWETVWTGSVKYRCSIPQVQELIYSLLFLEALVFATGKFLPVFGEIASLLAKNTISPTALGLIEAATRYLGVYEVAEIFLETPVQPRTQDMIRAIFVSGSRKLLKEEYSLAQELTTCLKEAAKLPVQLAIDPFNVISRALGLDVAQLGNRVLLCTPLLVSSPDLESVEKIADWIFRLRTPLVSESRLPRANYQGLLENLFLFKDFLNPAGI